jgi:small conductance mechanosensitive channel
MLKNSQITSDAILNYTAMPIRRMDLTIGVAYDADLQQTKQVLFKIIEEEPRFLKDPEPRVEVMTLNDSSVDFVFRPWVKSEDYWDTRFDTLKKIKIELDNAGIGIPFPQRDVRLIMDDSTDIEKITNGKKKAV